MPKDMETLQKCEELVDNSFLSEDHEYRPPDPSPMIEDWKNDGEGDNSNDNGGDNSMPERTENLQKYEELFAHRFSSEDHEYQQYRSRPPDPPPIVEEWRDRGGGNYRERDNRYRDRRGWGGDRGWGGERGWRGHHRQQHWHGGNQDRHSWDGNRYQSGPQSSNQGYSSHRQRPHYDRY